MSEGTSRLGTVVGRVQDDLRRQTDERWRKLPDEALVTFVWFLELRQWDLQVEIAAEDDPLESAKKRGAVLEIQAMLDVSMQEAARRQAEKLKEKEVKDE